MVPVSRSSGLPPVGALRNAPDSRGAILRVPVALLRFHQPMAEHGPGACAQPIGAALPAGHCHFRSSSE